MTFLKKSQTFALISALVLTLCFPPVTKKAGAVTLENSIYYVKVEELKGKSSLGQLIIGVIGGLLTDTKFNFSETKIKGLELSKLVNTEQGPMVVTITSDKEDELIDAGELYINTRKMNFNFWRTLGDLPSLIRAGTVYDITANIIELESTNIQIEDLVVEVSFDPNEIARIQNTQRALEVTEPKDNIEELLLALDEAEGGKLTQQTKDYKALLTDLPIQQENTNKVDKMLEQAERQQLQLDTDITHLEDLIDLTEQLLGEPKFDEMIEKAQKQYELVTVQWDEFTSILEQTSALIEHIQNTLLRYTEIVNLRFKYLKELGLDDWSKSYQQLEEVNEKLKGTINMLKLLIERLQALMKQKEDHFERINKSSKSLEGVLHQNIQKLNSTQEKESIVNSLMKLLDKELEKLEENDTSVPIDEEENLEELQHEFENVLIELEQQMVDLLKENGDQQKEVLRLMRETLAIYSSQLIKYSQALNKQQNELLLGDEAEQVSDLENKLSIIEAIIARIEELEQEIIRLSSKGEK